MALVMGAAAGLAAARVDDSLTITAFVLATLMGAIGLVDDVRSFRVLARLVLQVAVGTGGAVVLASGIGVSSWSAIAIGMTMALWVVGFVNAFNFMDGINGISIAQLLLAGSAWTVAGLVEGVPAVVIVGAVTVGTAAGVLPWNFPNARFFIGDVGSYFSGAWLASVSIVGMRLGIAPIVIVAPLVLYAADTSVTFLRRLIAGKPVLRAHRSHVYQQLVVAGWSHTKTTAFFASCAAIISVASFAWLTESAVLRMVGTALTGAVATLYLLAPLALARIQRQRRSGRHL